MSTAYRTQEISLPTPYWNNLSPSDKTEFQRLRNNFHQSQKMSSKDRRLVSFSNELITILKFIERSESGRENRTVLVGVCFAGPFIGVNTRQLKNFLGRCKSSINGSFQQLGYVALRTKSKARTCVLSIIPSLINDQNILRQWTVRCAADDAQFCFITNLRSLVLPTITSEDLNDEHRNAIQIPHPVRPKTPSNQVQFKNPISAPVNQWIPTQPSTMFAHQPNDYFGSQTIDNQWTETNYHELPASYSTDFSDLHDTWIDNSSNDWNNNLDNNSSRIMPRSQSACFDFDGPRGSFSENFSMF